MTTLKKLYRDFFGLTEQATKAPADPTKDVVLSAADTKDPKKVQAAQNLVKTTKGRIHIEDGVEPDLDEAKLDNSITDYQGGVEYVILQPENAQAVADSIRQWAEKKGFTVIKQQVSKSGRVGYFYFRLGQDPAAESQKIQGYFAQRPELKHFRFNVRNQKPKAKVPAAAPIVKRPSKF
jgi:hypothetical protein